MFFERLEAVKKQMDELQKTISMIKYKCWYYDTALTAGCEEAPKNMPVEKIPEEIQRYRHDYLG